jgi:hypothetical protein
MSDFNNQQNDELSPELSPEQLAELQSVVLGNLMLTAGILIGLSLEKTDNDFLSAIVAVQELDEDDLQEIMQRIINYFNQK